MSARTIHPFPARMAPEIALDAIPERESGVALKILDPMCGSGTVLAAATARGHHAIGVDIDPLAVMMSTLAVTEVDTSGVLHHAIAAVESAKTSSGLPPWKSDRETAEFVDYWFAEKQKMQLIDLTTAIESIEEEKVRLVLQLAISRIIVTKSSQASLAQDTSHSRPHRVRTESDYDVFAGFERSVKQLVRMLDKRSLNGSGIVELGDARDLSNLTDDTVDIAVTSPPYLNALDYLRGHKLALVWFGYTIPQLRARRSASIGSERRLERPASETVVSIIDIIENEATDRAVLKRPMLERFAHDCIGFASELAAKIKPGGKAVLVVGNSTLRGNYIKNDLIAQKAMEEAGFSLISNPRRPIPEGSRYMAIKSQSAGHLLAKRMREEVVLTLTR